MIVTIVLAVAAWAGASLVGGVVVGQLLRRRHHPTPVRRVPSRPVLARAAS